MPVTLSVPQLAPTAATACCPVRGAVFGDRQPSATPPWLPNQTSPGRPAQEHLRPTPRGRARLSNVWTRTTKCCLCQLSGRKVSGTRHLTADSSTLRVPLKHSHSLGGRSELLQIRHILEHGEILLTFCGYLAVVITTSQLLSLVNACKVQTDLYFLVTQVSNDSFINIDTHSLVLGVLCCRHVQAKIPTR